MEGGSLSSPEFKEFAKSAVLFAHITSQVPGEKHGELFTEIGGRSFPYLVVMNADGKIVGEAGGDSVESFSATLEAAKVFTSISAKASPSRSEKVALLVAKLTLGKLNFEQAKAERDAIGKLNAADAKTVAGALVDLEILHMLENAPMETTTDSAALGKRFYAMYQEGVRPRGDEAYQPFYMKMIRYAEAELDTAIFELSIKAMHDKYGHLEEAAHFFHDLESRFEELKKEASK